MQLDLVPLHLKEDMHPVLQILSDSIDSLFGIRTNIRSLNTESALGLDTLRDQYHSTVIINYLSSFSDKDFILGVTGVDLFIPIFTFVLGEAQLGGRSALVSSYRLKDSTYGLPENPELLFERLEKVTFHEIAHMLGLAHCLNSQCVMHAVSSVEEVDLRGNDFCLACHRLLSTHLKNR